MRVVKAAGVQLSPVLYSREGTVDKVVRKIHELGRQGVQFATFPETVAPYYPYFSFVQSPYQIIAEREHLKLLDPAVTLPSPATNAFSEACKEAAVVVSIGVNERDGGTLYNTQLLFDAGGTVIQRRRKTTPTYHERMIWGQGDGSNKSSGPCRDPLGSKLQARWTYGPRLYWDNKANEFNAVDISVRAAITVFSGEIYHVPRSWAERR